MRQAARMSVAVLSGTATVTPADSRPDSRVVTADGRVVARVPASPARAAGDTIFEDGFESTSAGRARAARLAAGQNSYRLPGRPEARDAGSTGPDRDVTYTSRQLPRRAAAGILLLPWSIHPPSSKRPNALVSTSV